MSKYEINGLPWSHGIGTDVQECTTAKEVIEKAGLNWIVDKCDLVAEMPFTTITNIPGRDNSIAIGEFSHNGNIYRRCPNGYATYRVDKNIPLGLVKSKYQVVQNKDAFTFFDEAIGPDKAVWQTAGMFGYGHKIFITAKLPITTTVKGDPIDNYLVFSNSHDGSSSLNIMFTPIRVFCTNCLNSAIKNADAYIRIRHTESAHSKLHEGAEILNIAIKYAKEAQQIYEALYSMKMNDDEVMKYIAHLVLSEKEENALNNYNPETGYKKLFVKDYLTMEHTEVSTRKVNQMVNMFEYYMDGPAQQQITGTAWGAYNAVTGFYSNVANLEGEKRMDSLLYGGAQSSMQKAFVNAYDLVLANR